MRGPTRRTCRARSRRDSSTRRVSPSVRSSRRVRANAGVLWVRAHMPSSRRRCSIAPRSDARFPMLVREFFDSVQLVRSHRPHFSAPSLYELHRCRAQFGLGRYLDLRDRKEPLLFAEYDRACLDRLHGLPERRRVTLVQVPRRPSRPRASRPCGSSPTGLAGRGWCGRARRPVRRELLDRSS